MVEILKKESESAHSFNRNNLLLGFFTSALFWTYPIISGQRDLPYGIYMPGVDNKSSPFYEIAYICQVLFTICGCCLYIPFSSLLTSFIKLGIALILILQHKLNTIAENSSKNGNERQRTASGCYFAKTQALHRVTAEDHHIRGQN